MKDLVIIGGAAPESINFEVSSYREIIAADSGYDTAKRLGLTPTKVVGDFDSTALSSELKKLGYIPCNRDKDDTDAAIAIKLVEGDYDLIGGGEGRIDHTLSLLVAFRTLKAPSLWYMRADTLRLVNDSVVFEAPCGVDISIIPLDKATVTTHGLKWDITDMELSERFISQSNRVDKNIVEIITDSPVFLRFFPSDYSEVRFL